MPDRSIHARPPRGRPRGVTIRRDADSLGAFLKDAAHFAGGHASGLVVPEIVPAVGSRTSRTRRPTRQRDPNQLAGVDRIGVTLQWTGESQRLVPASRHHLSEVTPSLDEAGGRRRPVNGIARRSAPAIKAGRTLRSARVRFRRRGSTTSTQGATRTCISPSSPTTPSWRRFG